MDPLRGAIAGAVGGFAGAYAMERFQLWWEELEARARPPRRAHALREPAANERADGPATVKVAERISERVLDTPLPEERTPKAGQAVHYGFGMLSGAGYGFIGELLPPVRAANGLLFGAALWWVADNVAIPAQGLGASPERTPPSRQASALAAHLVYGVVTETVRFLVRVVL